MKKSKFTLVELMFVVAVLVILIGLGVSMGSKTLRKSAEQQSKAEIKMIISAVKAYKARYGDLPNSVNGEVDFAEYFSKVSPHSAWVNSDGTPRKREMFIDIHSANFNAVNKSGYEYTMSFHGATIPQVSLNDPYDNTYVYEVSGDVFNVYSVGIDGVKNTSDDVRLK